MSNCSLRALRRSSGAPLDACSRHEQDEAKRDGARSKNEDSRNYGLDSYGSKELAEEYATTKTTPNPFHRGAYFYFNEALKELDVDKAHRFVAVRDQMRKLTSAAE